ncbi:GNAT family N-acetyltransferase [Temperatibacter marinus]|uniref:GNAT family N-acetyltransferase n=1 Tax=Temperatibacter marinus TaxID=1456591 RepID=A0AA52H8P1_9PROT|nr:GNAT family N-acetyltransferase [Temperatibacter marinus]WND02316.1 GNAT family N-acetyltransferase [Temperatibacter marinus]
MVDFSPYKLTLVKDEDSIALIQVIDSCFKEYEEEGVFIDLEDLDADLHAMRTKIDQEKGEFWVLWDNHTPIATVGVAPLSTQLCELKRLYMLSRYRGQGIADKLLQLIEEWARDHGAAEMTMWSDTRFTRAHGFYTKKGYQKQPKTRDLNDLSHTTEFEFRKQL